MRSIGERRSSPGVDLWWVRLLFSSTIAINVADRFFSTPQQPFFGWAEVVSAAIAIFCVFFPHIGVPISSALLLVMLRSPEVIDAYGWLHITLSFSLPFVRPRWMQVMTVSVLVIDLFAVSLRAGSFQWSFFLSVFFFFSVGWGLRWAWLRSISDEDDLSHLIDERQRVKLRERAALISELDALMVTHLNAVSSELEAKAEVTDEAVLHELLTMVDVSARRTLNRLRQTVGLLRGESSEDSSGRPSEVDLGSSIDHVEDSLVGYGHQVEVDVGKIPPINPVLVNVVVKVLELAAERAQQDARAGSTCQMSARAEGKEVSVSFTYVDDSDEQWTSPELEAVSSRIRLVGGKIQVEHMDALTRVSATVPCVIAAAEDEEEPDTLVPWRYRIGKFWLKLLSIVVLSVFWLFPAAHFCYEAITYHYSFPKVVGGIACDVVAICFVVMTRRIRLLMPLLGVLLVVSAFTSVSEFSMSWAWLSAGFAVMVERKFYRSWAVLGLLCVWKILNVSEPVVLIGYLQVTVVFIAAGATVKYFREHRRRILLQIERQRQAVKDVRMQERRLLAGELHDVVAHQLSLITMQVGALAETTDTAQLQMGLQRLAMLNRAAEADLCVLKTMMSSQVNDNDMQQAVNDTVDSVVDILRGAGFAPKVDVPTRVDELSESFQHTIVRFLRECSTNMLRYAARGSSCEIQVDIVNGHLLLQASNLVAKERKAVSDLSTGHGLVGLAERIDLQGGSFESGESGGQWIVYASLPLYVYDDELV